jgi:diaminohydroxyphosphoribosylaminopyrimidine deaminase/5-amino-6-(5-phosphoribosylamino)uracil reductase
LDHILRALELAEKGRGLVSPNPLVGCVLVAASGEVVGEGWHARVGGPHAEAVALGVAGEAARGATAYITLEPCNHFGRTPPCTRGLIEAGVRTVVASVADPNPLVSGGGFAALRDAGIRVEVGAGAAEATRLNEAFFKHVITGRPFVTLKIAASLDGRVAASDGSATRITSETSRQEVHRMRGASDAILVGAGTAIVDDPMLTVRDPDYAGDPPLRVLVDASGRTPSTGHLFDGVAPTLVATTSSSSEASRDAWASTGVEVVVLDEDARGELDLGCLLDALGKRDVQSLLVEGGPTIAWSFVADHLVDRFVLFMAPKLVGGTDAPRILEGAGFPAFDEGRRLEISSVRLIGPDLKVEVDVHRDS